MDKTTWHVWPGRIPLQLFHELIWSDKSLILMRWEWGDYEEKSLISPQQSWESNYPFHVPSERLQQNEREERFFFLCWHPADHLRTLITPGHEWNESPRIFPHAVPIIPEGKKKKAGVGSVASPPQHQSLESNPDPGPCLSDVFWSVRKWSLKFLELCCDTIQLPAQLSQPSGCCVN